jgi:enamine deaminase RidA (YjgF/YER057c/UK114 family)
MNYDINPFSKDNKDRYEIWEKVVRVDIDAFLAQDWGMCEDDLHAENFIGINANKSANPDSWSLSYDSLDAYKQDWLRQAKDFANNQYVEDKRETLFNATTLRDIEIKGDSAVLHKKFDGSITRVDGVVEPILWQTIYKMKKINNSWKIIGFIGYMPNPMGANCLSIQEKSPSFNMPQGASQHKTAGPYSPVLEVEPSKIVVISGQAPIDVDGNVVGNTIEEQTIYTINSCKKQLQTAGVELKDVFKVNAWLTNLDEWPRFNKIYSDMMSEPYPVRAVVEAGLLYTFKVEIEMWAIKQ